MKQDLNKGKPKSHKRKTTLVKELAARPKRAPGEAEKLKGGKRITHT